MILSASTETEIACPPAMAFEYLTDAGVYPVILTPLFPLAGIRQAQLIDASQPAVGVQRLITMTDGVEIMETIDQYESPVVHGYSWGDGVRPPLSLLVRHAAARWDFIETAAGTHVRWSYEFTLTNAVLWPVGKPIVLRLQAWMNRGIQQARIQLESTRHSNEASNAG